MQGLLGEQIFAERWAEGRTLTAEEAIAASPTRDRTSKAQRPAQGRPQGNHKGPPHTTPPSLPLRQVVQPLLDPLSQRELEVLQLLAGGASNQEIATALVVAPGTDQKTGTRPRLLERAFPRKVLCICPRFSSRSPTMLAVYAPRGSVTMCIMIRTWHGSEVAALCISRVMSVEAESSVLQSRLRTG